MGKDELADTLEVNPTIGIDVRVRWRVRGLTRRDMVVSSERDSELVTFIFELLRETEEESHTVRLSPTLRARLQELKLLISPSEWPRDVSLEIDLPDHLPDLLPKEAFENAERIEESLVLHDGCHLQTDVSVPLAIAPRVWKREVIPEGVPILWVDDPGTEVLTPFGLQSDVGQQALSLLQGRATPASLSAEARRILSLAGILVPRGFAARRVAEWARAIEASQRSLASAQHAILRGVLNPLSIAAYRKYTRAIDREGYLMREADLMRRSAHREPLGEFLHTQLLRLVNRVIGTPLKDTFNFFGVYPPTSFLTRHTDRPQCRWNVSLVLDADPETKLEDAWPLFIEGTPVKLGLGDGVLYSGTEVSHWRDPQPAGHTTAAVFFHFVPVDFDVDRE